MDEMCPVCGSERATSLVVRHSRVVAGITFGATLAASCCLACGERRIEHETIDAFDHAVAVDVAQRGPTSGETFRFLRRMLPMPSAELAQLLEIDPATLRRWEEDASTVERVAWLVVAGLVLESIDANASTSVRLPGATPSARTSVEIELPRARASATG